MSARPVPLSLRFGFWFCVAIAIAVVIRRIVALTASPGPSTAPMAGLDLAFAHHAVLTFAHIIPALMFVLLAPVVMFRKRGGFAWADALLYPVGAVVGLTAYAMSAYAIGGWLERSAVLVFDSFFLFSLWQAWHFRSLGQGLFERRWLLRAIVVLLGIATTRPVMGVFFATSRLTHLQPEQFFGMAFWIGFSINTIVVELWLQRRSLADPAPLSQGT
ncbi:MAG: DUF2306 domain-containing protein [Bryobacteraceae bacterium]